MEKPQIISHIQKSLNYTLFDSRWIPCSAKFVVLGNYARGTGAMQIYECSKGEVNLLHEVSVETFSVNATVCTFIIKTYNFNYFVLIHIYEVRICFWL